MHICVKDEGGVRLRKKRSSSNSSNNNNKYKGKSKKPLWGHPVLDGEKRNFKRMRDRQQKRILVLPTNHTPQRDDYKEV
jgi:hypothetical protein